MTAKMGLSWLKILAAMPNEQPSNQIVSQNWFEKALLIAIFGVPLPIGIFLAAWWSSFLFASPEAIALLAQLGLAMGLLLDILFLPRWLPMAYRFPLLLLGAIYLFYSVGMFGFFMGVPVFNLVLGPLAGYYIGRRILYNQSANKDAIIHRVSLFTAFVLTVACLAAWLLAASEVTLAGNINGMLRDMLGWNLALNNPIILGFSALAGILLVILEYYLTRAAALFGLRP